MVFILYARAPLFDFWGAVMLVKAYVVFARAVLDLAKSGFCKFIGNFLVLVSQISFGNFFKIWQHGKTRFRFDDEHFKFTNQKLQYFLTMKTTYFNITEKLTR